MNKRRYKGFDYEAVNHPDLPQKRMPKPKPVRGVRRKAARQGGPKREK